jgi:hypothetical protein
MSWAWARALRSMVSSAVVSVRVHGAGAKHLGPAEDGGQRGPQFVRDGRQKFVLEPARLLDPLASQDLLGHVQARDEHPVDRTARVPPGGVDEIEDQPIGARVMLQLDRNLLAHEGLGARHHLIEQLRESLVFHVREGLVQGLPHHVAAAHEGAVGGVGEGEEVRRPLQDGDGDRGLHEERMLLLPLGLRLGARGLLSLQEPGVLVLRQLAARDVLEDERHQPLLGPAHAAGVHVEPAIHGGRVVLEASGLPRVGHRSVEPEPGLVEGRHQLERRLAHGVPEARLPLEGGVGLEKAVIDRHSRHVDDHLHQAKAVVDRLEERAIALLAEAQLVGQIERWPGPGTWPLPGRRGEKAGQSPEI